MTFYCYSATAPLIVYLGFIEPNKIKFFGHFNINLMSFRYVSSLNKANAVIDFSSCIILFGWNSMEFDKDRSLFECFESLDYIRREKG